MDCKPESSVGDNFETKFDLTSDRGFRLPAGRGSRWQIELEGTDTVTAVIMAGDYESNQAQAKTGSVPFMERCTAEQGWFWHNHGGCAYCEGNRLHKHRRRMAASEADSLEESHRA
ncbi:MULTISPECIES: hypothetical protein [unclassified Endozoicomonas]|uniref:hypothetical protein n=1 Tax=unclassified Endozoicomonas TaxID=2644528 RepID=UPI002148EAB2|nr:MULTISPECIES: hypothetical protein [unclassified Endozoicomonas]